MSLSNPKEVLARPAKKYIQFNGEKGIFTYWHAFDKDDPKYSEATKGERREISIENAIVLDSDLFSVTGYNKERGYFGTNEVRSPSDELVVRFFKENKADFRGNYEAVKNHVGREGRYTKCIYLYLNGEIVHLQIAGTCLSSWFDIENDRKKIVTHTIRVKDILVGDQGKKSEYRYATFEYGSPFSDEEKAEAIEADKELQEYLKKYFSKNGTSMEKDFKQPGSEEHVEKDSYDTNAWREFTSDIGVLGEAPMAAIYNQKAVLEDSGRSDTEEYAMVCQACYDYEQAKKQWKSKKDKSGKALGDYTLEEMKSVFASVMKSAPMNPARLYLEAGLCELEETNEENWDDDDIPF